MDTYGVPTYKEVNPALFTCVTFPFLYGIMYGDVGHGTIQTCAGLFLIFRNRWGQTTGLKDFFKLRYLIFLMGFFSVYSGLIYNDMMSIPINAFWGTCYTEKAPDSNDWVKTPDCVYSFGMDWRWYEATNILTFFNSFKMKLAVILGVMQMTLGIVLRGMNAIYFKDFLSFFTEVIP